MISLLLVDDHEAIKRTFRRYLNKQPQLQVRAMIDSGEEALQWLAEQESADGAADVVLVDLSLPGMNGIALIEALKARYPDLPCLVLSGYNEDRYVQRALDAGARGYIAKDDVGALIAGIERVLEGEIFLSDGIKR